MEPVKVYEAKDEMEATLIKGLLESAGIKAVISSTNEYRSRYSLNMPNIPHFVLVNKKDEAEALGILKEEKQE